MTYGAVMEIRTNAQDTQDYLTDESNIHHASPENVQAVYFPENEDDVIGILKEASISNTRVTISGAGTGITGSRVPIHGGIIISMERMLQLPSRENFETLEFQAMAGKANLLLNREDGRLLVPSGLTLIDIDNGLPYDLFHPTDPTERTAQIGGNVATNASGARGFFYGSTRDRIKGLRMILASGDIIHAKRGECLADENGIINFMTQSGQSHKVRIPTYQMPGVKNAAGLFCQPHMDLIDLLIGSEGLFGIFTEIELMVEEVPGQMIADIAFFDDMEAGMGLVDDLRPLKDRGILSLEFFNDTALDFIREEFPAIEDNALSAIFLELSSQDPELPEILATLLKKHGSLRDWYAGNRLDNLELKEFRHALPDKLNAYLKQHDSYKMGTDFAVPPKAFREMMAHYQAIGEEFKTQHPREGVHYTMLGHIGDHHVHFNFIAQTPEERVTASSLYLKLARKAIELGGTISAEHGVGKKTVIVDGVETPYLELMYGKTGLKEIAEVKKVFDPDLLLNIGNMVPFEYYD